MSERRWAKHRNAWVADAFSKAASIGPVTAKIDFAFDA
jgi:hypothetical protein